MCKKSLAGYMLDMAWKVDKILNSDYTIIINYWNALLINYRLLLQSKAIVFFIKTTGLIYCRFGYDVVWDVLFNEQFPS